MQTLPVQCVVENSEPVLEDPELRFMSYTSGHVPRYGFAMRKLLVEDEKKSPTLLPGDSGQSNLLWMWRPTEEWDGS